MSGTLARGLTTANVKTVAYQVPNAGINYAAVSVIVLNGEVTPADVVIYIASTPVPTKADRIDIANLPANGGKVTVNCNCLSPGDYVIVESSINECTYRVEGVFDVIPT